MLLLISEGLLLTIHVEFADNISNYLERRFDREQYQFFVKVDQVLLNAANSGAIQEDNFREVFDHFGTDLNHPRLKNQLAVLCDAVEVAAPSLEDVKESVLVLNTTSTLYSEVI